LADLFRALDPKNIGVVPAADFKLVLSLVMGETDVGGDDAVAADALTRKMHHEMAALVDKYRIDALLSSADAGQVPLRHTPVSSQAKACVREAEALRVRSKQQPPTAWSAPPSWPVGYERFVLDARLSRLQGIDWDHDPPVGPWTEEQKKKSKNPTALAMAVANKGAVAWGEHVAAFKARRLHAVMWLMNEGTLRATRARLNRDEAQRHLVANATRATVLTNLMAIARHAHRQVAVHQDQKQWLRERLARSKKHQAFRAEAFTKLKALMVVVAAEAAAANIEATNQNRVWARRFHAAQAQRWLSAIGSFQKVRVLEEKTTAIKWLVEYGKRAVAARPEMLEWFTQLKKLGRKAQDVQRKREITLSRIERTVDKAERLVEKKQLVFEFLDSKAEQSHGHHVSVLASVAFLQRLGGEARKVVFQEDLARKWLRETGGLMSEHIVRQFRARTFLAKRRRGAAAALQAQRRSAAALTAIARQAEKQLVHEGGLARGALTEVVLAVRVHRYKRAMATEHLEFFVAGARVKRGMQRATARYPERLEKLIVDVRAEDKKKEADRRLLDSEERLRLEMFDAFNAFDLDGSGEIDPLEFRAIIVGGALFSHIPPKELEDVFVQIDKDRSGAVSFDEFYSWFLFENDKKDRAAVSPTSPTRQKKNFAAAPSSPMSPTRQKKGVTAAAILPARERAARLLYLEALIEGGLDEPLPIPQLGSPGSAARRSFRSMGSSLSSI
jgi:hypothetical protein